MSLRDLELDEATLLQQSRENWSRHWDKVTSGPPPDLFSRKAQIKRFFRRGGSGELAWRIVLKETGFPKTHLILEAGCGIAELSLRLAAHGNQIMLLDTSRSALLFDLKRARDFGLPVYAVQASILHMPFKPNSFDSIFNVGVLDHFGLKMRSQALAEMLRMAGVHGRAISINNDIRSLIHPIAMRHAQKTGRWPFGFKAAISSLKPCLAPELSQNITVREYSRGMIGQLEYLHYFFNSKSRWHRVFLILFYLLSCICNFLNRFPGQFRVTIIAKRNRKT
ncbi:MAG: class I SAM-dependent methyltransferase [bacterium]|nr:class I SAM-dependent methyltransferase [bacterium]